MPPPEDGKKKKKEERIRFPFGESMDGSFDKYLRSKQLDPEASDALGPAFESDAGRTPLPLLRPDRDDSDVGFIAGDDSGEDPPSDTGLVLESDEGEIASPFAQKKAPSPPPPPAKRPLPPPIELDDEDEDGSSEVRSPLAKARPASPAPPPRTGGESSDIKSPLPVHAKKFGAVRWDPAESVDGPVFEGADSQEGSDEGILAGAGSDEDEVDYPDSGEELLVPGPGRGQPARPAAPAPPPLAPPPPAARPAAPPTPGPLQRPAAAQRPPAPPTPGPLQRPAAAQRPPAPPTPGPLQRPAAAQRPPAPPTPGPLQRPAAAQPASPGEQTLPPFYPQAPRPPGAEPLTPGAALPRPEPPGGIKATLPPTYPAPPQRPQPPNAGGARQTLPPTYPVPPQLKDPGPAYPPAAGPAAQKTLQPGYGPGAPLRGDGPGMDPFGSAGGRGRTLPPTYPTSPTDPAAQKTLQPGYTPHTDPFGSAGRRAAPQGGEETLAPAYPPPKQPPAGDPFASSRGRGPAAPPPPAFDPRRTVPPEYPAPLPQDEGSSESVPSGHAFRNMIDTKGVSGRSPAPAPIPRTRDEFDPTAAPMGKGSDRRGAVYAVSLSDDGAINVESDIGAVDAGEPDPRALAATKPRPTLPPTKPVPRPEPKVAAKGGMDLLRTQPVDLDAFDELKSDSGEGPLAQAGVGGGGPPLRSAGITAAPPSRPGKGPSKPSRLDKASRLEQRISGLRPAMPPLRAQHGSGSGEWLVEDSAEGNALALLKNLRKLSSAGVIHPSDEGELLLGESSDVNAFRRTMELPALQLDGSPLFGSDEVTPIVMPPPAPKTAPPPSGRKKSKPKDGKAGKAGGLLDFEDVDEAVASAETVPAMKAVPRPGAGLLAPAIPIADSESGIGPVAGESALDELGKSVMPESAEVLARPQVLDSGEVLDQDEIETSDEASALAVGLPSSASQRAPKLEAFFTRAIQLWESDALWILLGMGGATLGPVFMFLAWGYYSLPTIERFSHPWHDQLKPGGEYGLVFGIAASALFLANLSYVLRRRFGLFKKLISLRLWLNVHFVCGLVGASLVLAHSALLGNNWVALVCSGAIAVAVLSGIFGRYVLFHLPRYHDGEEDEAKTSLEREIEERKLSQDRLTELAELIRAGLAEHPRLRDAALEALAAHANPPPARGLLFAPVLLVSDFRAMVRNRRLATELKNLLRTTKDKQARAIIQDTLRLIRNQSRLERRLAEAEAVRDLMDTWRGIHFIVALVAVVTMGLHVFLARFAV